MPNKVTVKDLTGGLSLREPELLDNNQFEELKNFYYNQDKRLQTRRGITTYFDPLPDTVETIEECNATANFAVSGDADTLATGTAIRGTNSVSHAITVSGTSASLTGTISAVDISSKKGYLGFWYKVPTDFTGTGFTSVTIQLGTDSSNYYKWTVTTLTENQNTYLKLNFSDATTTGTVNDASITHFLWKTTYVAGYANQSGILVDAIRCYSPTSTTPVTSYHFNQDDQTGDRVTIAVAGANMYHWNVTGWDLIDSGLTEYETATGKTTQRTRWGFFTFRTTAGNVLSGMCNGIDDYRVWNGVVMANQAAEPKYRYFRVNTGVIVAAGVDDAPFDVYYTDPNPANINTLSTNQEQVGNEFDGRINAIYNLGKFLLVGKSEKIYYVVPDSSGVTVEAIDPDNGMFSDRVTQNVGNAILYQTKNGIDNLKQKGAATGAAAIEGEAYSANLQNLISKITANQWNANCGHTIEELNNMYFTFDTGDDNIPETTLVYSSLIGKSWSQYTYPAAYQYGVYIDDNNAYNHLLCSANAGIIYKIETGFDDNGVPIDYEFKTKRWDFDRPSAWKDWHAIDLYGLKNEGSEFTIEILVSGDVVYSAVIDDTYLDLTSVASTIASDPIADEAIGGGGLTDDDIDLYRYRIRLGGSLFAGGNDMQIRGYTSDTPTVFTFDRAQITYEDNTIDVFSFSNCA